MDHLKNSSWDHFNIPDIQKIARTANPPRRFVIDAIKYWNKKHLVNPTKKIAFIGDSGGNQAMQQAVADKLNTEWNGRGAKVIQVGDYYKQNGQVAYLLNQGFSSKQIGGHAGIRDSSELLAVNSDGVRRSLLRDYSSSVFTEVGADGDSSKANVVIGRFLLGLKINAAVKQIQNQL